MTAAGKLFDRLVNRLVGLSTVLGAVTLVLMMLAIVADVLSTNFFGRPLPAASVVVTAYFMVLTVFLPMALAQKVDAHVVVDIVHQHLPPGLRKLVDILVAVMMVAICGVLVVALWGDALGKTAIASFVYEQNVRVPTWPGYYALPVGFALMILVILVQIRRALSERATEQEAGKADVEGMSHGE